MEKWKEICGREAGRLREARELFKHVDALVNHGEVRSWLSPDDLEGIAQARKKIENKLRRLEKGEFHIAVVGLEKSGKSSFINAWIGEDLLPNKQKRCTFTTTRLHSVLGEDEQRLEIRTKPTADFEKDIRDLEKLAKSENDDAAAKAKADLDLIRANMDQLRGLLDREIPPIHFLSLEEIAPDLEKYAADGRYAHAIAAVDLYTKSLAEMDGILFYDVPGIDSGLEKHKEETKKMLEDSDAVIIVKRSDQPDLKGQESDILRYAKSGDDSVPVRDKVFFFMSRIDDQKTREGYLKNRKDVLEQFKDANIDENKVVFGAAIAGLFLDNKLKELDFVEPRDVFKKRMATLLDLPSDDDNTIKQSAGVEELKKRMDSYLRNEREEILRKSCDKLVNELDDRAAAIQRTVRSRVPDNPAAMRENYDERIIILFNEWFNGIWEKIQAKISRDNANELITGSLKIMETDYVDKAKASVSNLKHFEPEQREIFFDAQKARADSDDLEVMNAKIREKINEEVLHRLEDLAVRLSSNLYDTLMKYMDDLGGYFNDSLDLRAMLLEKMGAWPAEYYKRQLESVLGALYLRYARPLALGLMRHRHGLPARRDVAVKYKNTFQALANCYPDAEPDEFSDLTRYIAGAGGKKSEEPAGGEASAKPGDSILGKIRSRNSADGAKKDGAETIYGGAKPVYRSRQDVVDELEEDRNALEVYLSSAVFPCSGIEEYAESEIKKIRTIMIELESRIRSSAQNKYNYRNPKILEIMPPELARAECDTKVAELLEQLTRALKARV
ncbi:MAG: dynamin family protein [Desulfovibrio sp.]|nr:dynamin family protein [Desulfovibrio sp.]